MKAVVAMSGGIDSTSALIRLIEQDYSVVGVTLKLYDESFLPDDGKDYLSFIDNAKRICNLFNIKHYVIDVVEDFHDKIINYFIDEYLHARTPNPCMFCNPEIKFKRILEFADEIGYRYIATGHYVNIYETENDIFLKKGIDDKKEQSYFVSRLTKGILRRSLFPLGNTTKDDNRNLLDRYEIKIINRRESYDNCFIKEKDYRDFIKRYIDEIEAGEIIDEYGKILGFHEGLPFYTIGQRRGLNIAAGKPIYVRELIPEKNQIVVGEMKLCERFTVDNINWLVDENTDLINECTVKIRYLHAGDDCIVKKNDDCLEVTLNEPSTFVTPGQAAVFYKNDLVLASGIIEETT